MLSLMMFKSSLVEAPPIPWSAFWDREALSALEVSVEAERARLVSCSGDAVWRWERSLCQGGLMERIRLGGTHGIGLCTNGSAVVPSLWACTPLSPWGAFRGSFPALESAHDAHCNPFPSRGRGTHSPGMPQFPAPVGVSLPTPHLKSLRYLRGLQSLVVPRQANPYRSDGILLQNLVLNGCVLSDWLEVSGWNV